MKYLVLSLLLWMGIGAWAQSDIHMINDLLSIDEKDDQLKAVEFVRLYGAGSLLSVASSTTKPEGSSQVKGSLGVSFDFYDANAVSIFFSYNGVNNVEVNSREQLGSALLSPGLNGNAFAFTWLYQSLHFPKEFGTAFSFNLVDNKWTYNDTLSKEISPILLKAGVFYKPFPFLLGEGSEESNKVNFVLFGGVTYRGFLGDFPNGDRKIEFPEEPDYELAAYWGLEFSAHLLVNSVDLFVEVPVNFTQNDIPGFSGGQVIFGLNISGDFITLR